MDIIIIILAVLYLLGLTKVGSYLSILTLGYFALKLYVQITEGLE